MKWLPILTLIAACNSQTTTDASGGATGTVSSQGFGGVQLGGGQLSEAECQQLRSANEIKEVADILPCECRHYSKKAVSCHPNCCPKGSYDGHDRCHQSNEKEWSPYEQTVCRPPTTQENFPGDGACLYNGGNPYGVEGVIEADGTIGIEFVLSKKSIHRCDDLLLSVCYSEDPGQATSFRFTTATGQVCWQNCPPQPFAACTENECNFRRGRTHPFVRKWSVPSLPSGESYLLSCVVTAATESTFTTTSQVNQTQYLPTAFYLSP
eukprot:TRINITY_DN33722_c0_g1_i1.p1 TRINITY_DN33722_c0_g1~~TRINITY_DN33722_c0_g1_i1.p1  ORF type:complete len:266 (+),score=32.68 TRINITY_DN33722_c0_g1_i1:33-830(+)